VEIVENLEKNRFPGKVAFGALSAALNASSEDVLDLYPLSRQPFVEFSLSPIGHFPLRFLVGTEHHFV
jgi:hypothetical protein